jgi:excisionase family DNA binding protein
MSSTNITASPTVDVPQAAEMMKVHPKTVLDLIDSGAIRAGKVGRSYVMLTRDVLAHIEGEIVRQTAARMRQAAKKTSPKPRSQIAPA